MKININCPKTNRSSINTEDDRKKEGLSMKLYTKTICPKCMWVKSELQQAGLEVEVINIDHNEEAKQKILNEGFLSVPVLEIDGELIGDVKEIISKIELVTQ